MNKHFNTNNTVICSVSAMHIMHTVCCAYMPMCSSKPKTA